MSSEVRLADWLVAALAGHGIRCAFMVAGGGAMYLNDALGANAEIEAICALHEQGAGIAAEAYAKQSGRPALCLVTAGPGGTNAITAVASAWVDSVPMIVVSGQAKRPDLVGASGVRQRGVQEVDIVSMVRPVTKSAVTLMDPMRVRYEVERAVHLATTGRPGPVWLDVPLDVQGAQIDPSQLEGFVLDGEAGAAPDPSDQVAADVLAMLATAKRPLFLLGAGIRMADAEKEVLALVESLGVPALSTWPAKGIVGDDHPLFVGCPGALAARGPNFALQAADLLVCLGARLDLATTGYDPKDFGRNAKKVVVEIDPFELAKLDGAIDVGHLGDVGTFARSLLGEVLASSGEIWLDTEGWVERCQTWRHRYPLVTAEHRRPSEAISTYRFAEEISELFDPDIVLAFGCSGLAIEIFLLAMRLRTGQRAIFGNALGPMGWGPPTALGACLASGRRTTICVDGDGGLQLNIQELETIRRLGLPVKLFVLANDGYASIRASQERWFGRLTGADATSGLSLPPLDLIAGAYGWSYRRLEGAAPIGPQMRAVLDLEGPVLCEVPTPRDEARQPVQTSEALPDGSMRSLPLEDLAPRLPRPEFAANLLGPDGRFSD